MTTERNRAGRTRPLGRTGRAVAFALVAMCCMTAGARAGLRTGGTGTTSQKKPPRVQSIDNSAHIDVNNIDMWVTNHGSFAWDIETGNAGLIFPKGTQNTAVFAAGLWLGAQINGEVNTTVAEYSQEYSPGPMSGGTFSEDHTNPNPAYHVYKITRDDLDKAIANDPADPPSADWQNWPVDQGAPTDTAGRPLLLGDQTLWSVYNDADPYYHTNEAGSSDPMGIEIQQTTFGFARQGALGNAVFVKFHISNKGSNTLDSMFISLWSDPDLGGATDDLVGCDTTLSVGYVYNATNQDQLYGARVPALGFDFLQGPIVAGDTLGMTSFNKYINGTDPSTRFQTYNYMKGLTPDGDVVYIPNTSQPTTFVLTGDPVTHSGWLDTNPADRRLMLTTGPITMNPGDTQDIVAAIVVGQGADRLSSITLMKLFDQKVQEAYDLDFDLPSPPPSPKITARPLDRSVDLLWDTRAQTYMASNPFQTFVFEGYNIYQGQSASGPWKKIATYDVIDTVGTIYEEVVNPTTGALELVVTQLGTESGLANHLLVTDDAWRGGRLVNGTPYYFAVTAYGYETTHTQTLSGFPGLVTEVLESSIPPCDVDTNRVLQPLPEVVTTGCVRVVPGSSAAALEIDARHLTGVSQGSVTIDVLNQALVTGDTYRVTFRDSLIDPTDSIVVWDLYDVTTSTYLLRGVSDQTGPFTSPVVDGFMIRVVSPTAGILRIEEVATCGGTAVDPPKLLEDSGGYHLNSTGDWYEWSLGSDFKRHNWFNPTTHDYELRFLASATEHAWDFAGDCGAPVLPFLVPVEAWDITTNTRITFQMLDNNEVPDGVYDWDDGIYLHDIPYADVDWATATDDTPYDPNCLGLSYRRFFFVNYSGVAGDYPCAGTVMRILSAKPNLPEDVFEFTVPKSGQAPGTVVTNDLGRIRVVPNPYFNRSRYELNQFDRIIKFTNLPASQKVTIRIFNLAGDLVRTMVKDATSGNDPSGQAGVTSQAIMRWDLNTDRNLPVASGVYIYHVDVEGVGQATGRLIVFTEKERLNTY